MTSDAPAVFFFFFSVSVLFFTIDKIQPPKWRHLVHQFHLLLQGQTHLDTLDGRDSPACQGHAHTSRLMKSNNVLSGLDGRRRGGWREARRPCQTQVCWRRRISLFHKVFFLLRFHFLCSLFGFVFLFRRMSKNAGKGNYE